jgi:hypothetical protein
MIGGLLKSTASRLALLAAAGVVMGGMAVPSAKAADLGGDCCADLEERVAELEATTARKGNRKMSLTVYGQVNRAILYWNDGRRSNTYVGLDNHNSASRFGFMGSAKISPAWSAGYSILVDWGDKARTSTVSQTQEEGSSKGFGADVRNDDGYLRLRDVNFWLEHKTIGRATVGRITNSGQNGFIDLGGTSAGVGSDPGCDGGGFAFRNKATNALSTTTIGSLVFNCGGPIGIRLEGIKYTSPTVAGFIFDATIGEALKAETSTVDNPVGQLTNVGRVMGVNLKYAGEFSGFRVAAGVGAEWSRANEDDSIGFIGDQSTVALGAATNGIKPTNASADNAYWAVALSLMHVPSGLFAQGHYTKLSVGAQNPLTGAFDPDKDASRWDIQAGISKNWFGIGNTVLYGEYNQHKNFKYADAVYTCPTGVLSGSSVICATTAAPSAAKGDELKIWGLGLVQNIDAAATELYVSYRHFEAKDPAVAAGLKDIDIVITGARVKF